MLRVVELQVFRLLPQQRRVRPPLLKGGRPHVQLRDGQPLQRRFFSLPCGQPLVEQGGTLSQL